MTSSVSSDPRPSRSRQGADSVKRWARRLSEMAFRPFPARIGIVLWFLFALYAAWANVRLLESWGYMTNRPPYPGDGTDYDMLALNLQRGWGFGFDWEDPEWRAPYLAYDATQDEPAYGEAMGRTGGFARTAFRPPGFPLVLAAVYVATRGENRFLAWRVVGCCLVALAMAMAAALAHRLGGSGPACCAALLSLADLRLRQCGAGVLTESLAACNIGFLAYLLLLLWQRPNAWRATLAGALFAWSALTRTEVNLWLPFVALCLFLLPRNAVPWRKRLGPIVVLLVVTCGIQLPWWTRNCIVLRKCMPLGTNGPQNLWLAWNDLTYERKGMPWAEGGAVVPQGVGPAFNSPHTGILYERDGALYYQFQGMRWLLDNPGRAIILAGYKLLSEWREEGGYRPRHTVICALALLGFCALLPGRRSLLLAVLVACNSLCVVAAFAVGGRLLVPIHPILLAFGGVGVAGAVLSPRLARSRLRESTSRSPEPGPSLPSE